MSSQPHIVLPWVVRRTRLPLLSLRCVDCRSESATTGEGRFRVNANGKLLDVWLLVRCVSCDRTSKLTVHERAPVRSIDPAELDGYHANDPELVASRLLDPLLARRNRFSLDWTGAWRLDTPSAWLDEAWPVRVEVVFQDPVPVRPERLIAQGLGLSRSEALRRIKVRHSAAPSDDRRIHLHRDGRGLAGTMPRRAGWPAAASPGLNCAETGRRRPQRGRRSRVLRT